MENEKNKGIPGLAIFGVGLGLLFFVFYLAYLLFQDPNTLTFVRTSPVRGEEDVFNQFFTNIILVAISLGALAIMGGASSKIASKGIELFKSRKS